MRLDLAGTPERNEANVITALSNDEAFAGALVFDDFRQEILVMRILPWDEEVSALPRPWSDADDVRCAEWLQRREINVAPAMVSRSVGAVAREMRVHPVRDLPQSPPLGWSGASGAVDDRLSRRRRHGAQQGFRHALDDLGGGAHHAARQSRPTTC